MCIFCSNLLCSYLLSTLLFPLSTITLLLKPTVWHVTFGSTRRFWYVFYFSTFRNWRHVTWLHVNFMKNLPSLFLSLLPKETSGDLVLLDKKHQVLLGLIFGPLAPSDHDHNRCPVASILSDLREISKFNKCKQYLTDMITQVVYQHETRYKCSQTACHAFPSSPMHNGYYVCKLVFNYVVTRLKSYLIRPLLWCGTGRTALWKLTYCSVHALPPDD